MELYDSLARWNLWGTWEIADNFPREITQEIYQYIAAEEVIALIGPRRAGKSTILYQMMSLLLANGVEAKAILHINFEEPGLSPHLGSHLLDTLYDLYRSRVYPKGKAYLFFDEIQNIPEWERWVRARNDTENIKIVITGSSSALLSGELASVLTGRNFCFNIFPRIALASEDHERERLLKRYFDEILFKDIVQRYEIRDVMALRNIAVHVLSNTSTLVTYKRLADIFQVSQDLAQNYLHYLNEAFMIKLLPFYSLKASERTRNPFKVHAIDLGLRNVVSLSASTDETKLIETQVHNTLLRKKQDGLFYWKDDGEIDLLTQQGITITQLFQVAYAGLDQAKVAEREFGGLQKALTKFPDANPYIITWQQNAVSYQKYYPNIEVIPLWHFLLD